MMWLFWGIVLLALIWVIALASYSAADPVWFFNTGSDLPPANFAGRIGAFIAELSYPKALAWIVAFPVSSPLSGS